MQFLEQYLNVNIFLFTLDIDDLMDDYNPCTSVK